VGLAVLHEQIADGDRYRMHPALLDACFHVLGHALAESDEASPDQILVPVAAEGVRVHRSGASSAWCVVTLLDGRAGDSRSISARVDVYGTDGAPLVTIDRLEVRRTARSFWEHAARDENLLYEVAWRSLADAGSPVDRGEPAAWLVFADATGVGAALAQALVQSGGAPCTTVVPGQSTRELGPGCWTLDPSDQSGLRRLLDEVLAPSGADAHAVYLWGLDAPNDPTTTSDVQAGIETCLHGALSVAQALGDHPAVTDGRLTLVTRGAQSVDGEATSPLQASLWGLGRVLMNELPHLEVSCIDVDPSHGTGGVDSLAAELCAGGDEEDQVAHRGGHRLGARLVRHQPVDESDVEEPYHLSISERGSLGNIALGSLERRSPGPDEVEIEVRATGVNFRDVLNVLGMIPGDPGPPGLECAGVVVAAGSAVTGLSVGDAVVGIAPQAFDSHVVTKAELVVPKPSALTFAEAATIPIAYLTATYGLHQLAGLQPGERVLVHAAAGGVGMAAVELAQRAGAEVYATVGSAAKRECLEALGVRHIYSSRTLDFAEQIMADTAGAGVDVVLNSLADHFIARSVEVLAPGGRFLELGKRGIWTQAEFAAVRPEGTYHPYDLADFLAVDLESLHTTLGSVVDDVAAERLRRLPLRAFQAKEIEAAFRYVAQARHIGKVVITHGACSRPVRPDGTYLVTGGLGGLGLAVAGRLVEHGAQDVVLLGRRPPSREALDAIAELEAEGARVRTFEADVTDPAAVERVVTEIASTGSPLRGVFHAAGIVDDGAIGQQRWERFEAVLAAKVTGAWLLDRATRTVDLEHFVLFSSASALMGPPGQSSYAAANSALDALAHRRRARGLPALSIDWGAWADVGMAARLDEREQRRLAERGVRSLPPSEALDALDTLLKDGAAQVAVMSMDWSTLLAGGPVAPMLSELAADRSPRAEGAEAETGHELLVELAAAEPRERRRVLTAYVQGQIVTVLGLDPAETIDPTEGLTDIGMDSLMAVELCNRLKAASRLPLPSTLAFEHPTLVALTDYLAAELEVDQAGAAQNGSAPRILASVPAAGAEDLADLSDEDVASQLLMELDESGY
jgi:NADPH:quinone reductase-like Zn-dependent oxidoreductase/acyl carrier protein